MNQNNTSEESKFNIGDLVIYVYQDSSNKQPEIGLVLEVIKVDYDLPEESIFAEHFYEYDIMWCNKGYSSVMFEMFLAKYEHEK